MDNEIKKVNDKELEEAAGGRIADSFVGGPDIRSSGNVKTVCGLATGWLALRNAPAYDSANEIGQLYNGDTVEVIGESVTVSNDFHGATTYTYVRSYKLHKDGYVNAAFLS